MRRPLSKRKCKHCRTFFDPDPRSVRRQRYCAQPACRQASKAASQRRWHYKPHNRDYFRDPTHVERVRQWRKAHPGSWRRQGSRASHALQEDLGDFLKRTSLMAIASPQRGEVNSVRYKFCRPVLRVLRVPKQGFQRVVLRSWGCFWGPQERIFWFPPGWRGHITHSHPLKKLGNSCRKRSGASEQESCRTLLARPPSEDASGCSIKRSMRYERVWSGPLPGRTNSNGCCCILSVSSSGTTA